MTASAIRSHRIGLLLVAAAALCWSSAGLFVRGITADLFTMLFWRGLFSGAGVFVIFFLIEGRSAFAVLKRFGWPAVAVMVASATSMITGIGSMRYTGVADALGIYATVPFLTAGIAWAYIGERPGRSTMIASAVAFLGVLVMLKDASFDGSLFGKGLALIMTLGMAVMTPIMRRHRDLPMLPAVGASAWLCSAVCLFAAPSLAISPRDLALCAAFGIVQNAAGLALYALGSHRLRASEATLLAAIEVPMTPFWVWAFIGETPAAATLAGGLIVLAAMVGHIVCEMWREASVPAAWPNPPPNPQRFRLLFAARSGHSNGRPSETNQRRIPLA